MNGPLRPQQLPKIYDGSCFDPIQAVVPSDLENYTSDVLNLTAGCSVSVTGELVFTQKVSEFQKTTINTNKIPVGVYFVVVKDKSKIITTQKWVKVE